MHQQCAMLFSSLRPSSAYLCWRLNLSQHGQPAFQRPYFPDGGSLLILRQWKHINSFSQCTISPRRITRSVEEEQPLCRSFLTRPRIGHSDDFLFGTMYRRCTPAGLWFRISSYVCVAIFYSAEVAGLNLVGFTAGFASRRKSEFTPSTGSRIFPSSHHISRPKRPPAINWTSASPGIELALLVEPVAFTSSCNSSVGSLCNTC